MIATMAMQSHRMATQDHHRFSNTAGSPLPIIPRRPSQMRPALTHSPSLPLPTQLSATSSAFSSSSSSTTLTSPYHDDGTASSSSEGSRPTIRTRRVRGVPTATTRNATPKAMCPPELSTPIPTISTTNASPSGSSAFTATTRSDSAAPPSHPMLYTPGMPLRLSMDSLASVSRNVSSTHVSSNNNNNSLASASGSKSASALCETFGEERPIRKKSGALVKSSLKSSRSRSTSSLAVYTSPVSSKSEPGTPSSKVVHFDAKLEHVKLFLAEQKPLAVSRDGSPTDDTSGTDSDFPRFIFGTASQARLEGGEENKRFSRKKLVMHVANMPVRAANYSDDVALEELCLGPEGANILGKVRVRNIAFSKSIAVRFTFDSWQTTSEVAAKYLESPSSTFDRFGFTIRLNDLLARIEGKTLKLAVRYSVNGQEIWDNNGGPNYLATFSKVKCDPPPGSDDEMSSDLRSRLEKVVQSKDRTGPAFAAAARHQPVPADADVAPSFRASTSFAARYDFATSFKSSWNPSLHNRTQSLPLSKSPSAIPWPQKNTLGSPRDTGDEVFHNVPRSAEKPFASPVSHAGRNHSRSYFNTDSPPPALLKRTPLATPRSPSEFRGAPSPSRFNSFPPMDSRTITTPTPLPSTIRGPLGYDRALVPDSGDSELSTPSMVSPSSSRESSPSPTEILLSPEDGGMSPETHYRQFLDKCVLAYLFIWFGFLIFFLCCRFCFFTGPGSTLEQHSLPPSSDGVIDGLPRTHSASDIQELLSLPSGISPRIEGLSPLELGPPSPSFSPTRSSSLDDLMSNRSGSLTPTVSRLSFASSVSAFENHVGTPVF